MKFAAFCLFLAVGFSSCSVFSIRDPTTGKVDASKVIRYIEPASYFACKTILDKAVDDEDRGKTALVVFEVAKTIRLLSGGAVPSQQELEDSIMAVAPKQIHWAQFATELGMIYSRFYESFSKQEKPAVILEALGELAEGCERAAKPYATLSSYHNYVSLYVSPFEQKRALMKPFALHVLGNKPEF
jgi:hypothetical protein